MVKKFKGTTTLDRIDLKGKMNSISRPLAYIHGMYVSDPDIKDRDDKEIKIDDNKLTRLSDIIANVINSVQDLDDICPYIGKAKVILKTLILYPNGKRKSILNYDTNNSELKNAKLHSDLLSVVEDYYNNDYKIENDLEDAVEALTVGSGSYIILNISRPALDNLINGSALVNATGNESLFDLNSITKFYKESVKGELEREFTVKAGLEGLDADHPLGRTHLMARNKGRIRDPKKPRTLGTVEGVESFLGMEVEKPEYEFTLIDETFGITVTDNLSTLSLNKMKERSDVLLSMVEGNEGLSNQIDKVLDKKGSKENKNDWGVKKLRNKDGNSSKIPILTKSQAKDLQKLFTDERNYTNNKTLSIKNSAVYTDDPYGTPIKLVVPSEAFIQCHVKGDPRKRNGGYILLNEHGEFVSKVKDDNSYNTKTTGPETIANKPKSGSIENLISQLKNVQQGKDCTMDMTEFAKTAKNQIEKELLQCIASGSDGSNISLELEQEVLTIFLERAFQKQRTRVLYVPEEYFTYMALNYNKLGFGQSFVMKARYFISRLATLDVADTIAQLENAQSKTQLEIGLEEHDGDPYSTVAMAKAAFFRNNPTIHRTLSLGTISLPDIVDAIREQSLVTKVVKNNNRFYVGPEMNVSPAETNNFKRIDDESRQYLLNQIANCLHLPKSWLDEGDSSANFQIEALNEQEILKNETVFWQSEVSYFFTDVIKKNILLNGPIKNKLINVIADNIGLAKKPDSKAEMKGDDKEVIIKVLTDFISNVSVSLTEPTTMEGISKLKEKLDVVKDLVEKWMDASSSKELMSKMVGKLGYSTEEIDPELLNEEIKAVFTYRALKELNLPTPYDDITSGGDKGGMWTLFNDLDHLANNMAKYLKEHNKAEGKRLDKFRKEIDKSIKSNVEPENDGVGAETATTEYDENGDPIESNNGDGNANGDDILNEPIGDDNNTGGDTDNNGDDNIVEGGTDNNGDDDTPDDNILDEEI